jgi:hypothetical protein
VIGYNKKLSHWLEFGELVRPMREKQKWNQIYKGGNMQKWEGGKRGSPQVYEVVTEAASASTGKISLCGSCCETKTCGGHLKMRSCYTALIFSSILVSIWTNIKFA